MSRIERAFENNFRAILGLTKPRDFRKADLWLRETAARACRERGIPPAQAKAEIYERISQRLRDWRSNHRPDQPVPPPAPAVDPPEFLCDAGLGGLARWLRAAGYRAHWTPDVDDDELLRQAQLLHATLLTTDSALLERRLLREGIIRALWVSPSFKCEEQLANVLHELNLPLRQPRCMSCGGELLAADKEFMRERIPPKTFIWLNTFFVCDQCGKLFWHGTHWQRIQRRLDEAVSQEC